MNRISSKNMFHSRPRVLKVLQFVTATLLAFCIGIPAVSQGDAGRIQGEVTDSNGGVVAGATVTVLDTQRGTTRTLTTDSSGDYSAPNLLPSTYTVRAALTGFKVAEHSGITLEINQDLRVDLSLQPGEQQQVVTVTTEVPLVETTNAELGGTVQSTIIENLPLNGRNFENLLQLRPGVTVMPGGAEFGQSNNGMRALDNVFMVNGINATEPWIGVSIMNANMAAGDAGTILSVDAIDEFKTESNPRAEFGWKPGGIVNVGVKSGTNAIHGSVYGYFRDTAFDARNYFDTPPLPKAPLGLQQFGGTVGGPIKKDKLFYFVNFEGQQYSIGNPIKHNFPVTASIGDASKSLIDACLAAAMSATAGSQLTPLSAQLAGLTFNKATIGTPTPTGNCTPAAGQPTGGFLGLFPVNPGPATAVYTALPSNNGINGGLAKIDYHLSDKNSIQGMYFISDGNNLAVDAPTTEVATQWFSQLHARAQTLSGSWTYVPDSRWVNEVRAGMGRYFQSYLSNDNTQNPASYTFNGATYVMPTGVTNPAYFGLPGISITGLSNRNGIGAGFYKIVGPDTALTFLDHVSYLRGAHAFKFGGEILPNYVLENVTSNAKGPVAFSGYTNFFEGNLSSANLMTGDPIRHLSNVGYSLFFQDDWRVRRTVILNLGLRYELTTVVKDSNNGLGNFDPNKGLEQVGKGITSPYNGDHNNFAPRLGVAWDIRGNGKTVLRIGAGIVYESQISFDVTNGIGNLLGLRTIPTGLPLFNNGSKTSLPIVGDITLASTSYTGAALTDPMSGINTAWQNFNPANPISTTGTGGLKGGPNAPLYASVASPACGDSFTLPSSGGFLKAPPPCSIVAIDPNLRTPYVENWNVGIERAITSKVSLDVTYVGNHAVKLLGKLDINQPQFVGGFSPGWGDPAVPTSAAGLCLASAPTYSNCGQSRTSSATYIANHEQAARPFTAPCSSSIAPLGVASTSGGVFNPNNSCFSFLKNITLLDNGYSSSYNGLQLTLTARNFHGMTLTAGYTYSHALGEGSDQGVPGGGELPVPLNSYGSIRGQLWAPTGFDIRHRGTISINYAVPGRDGFAQMLKGWAVNSVILLQSGLPMWQADTTDDFSGTGEAIGSQTGSTGESWNFFGTPSDFTPVHGFTDTNSGAGGVPYFPKATNAACLAQATKMGALAVASLTNLGCYAVGNSILIPPAYGSMGATQRNIWRAQPLRNVDLSVTKTFAFHDRYSAELRFEFFNLFNHPIFANPSSSFSGFQDPSSQPFLFNGATPDVASSNPQLGSGGSRSMQLGAKFRF